MCLGPWELKNSQVKGKIWYSGKKWLPREILWAATLSHDSRSLCSRDKGLDQKCSGNGCLSAWAGRVPVSATTAVREENPQEAPAWQDSALQVLSRRRRGAAPTKGTTTGGRDQQANMSRRNETSIDAWAKREARLLGWMVGNAGEKNKKTAELWAPIVKQKAWKNSPTKRGNL